MRKNMVKTWGKKVISAVLTLSLAASALTGVHLWENGDGKGQNQDLSAVASAVEVTADGGTGSGTTGTSTANTFTILTGDEMMEEMGAGWNLGNTMDGHTGFTPGETLWQPVKTTKALIKSVHDMGFNTVRIPITWGTMIDDDNDYAIDEKWMNRVQDIVDYCISQDMYAIINIHHDGAEQTGWLRIATKKQKALKKKYAGVWKNIALRFKDYDEHLIFESMNEVKGVDMTTAQENKRIMKLNQLFVDTVRSTGSNNKERWLMVPGKYNQIGSVTYKGNKFALPKDTVENRLIVSVHDYSPWSFCGTESTSYKKVTAQTLKNNENELKPLYKLFTSKGIPVVVGEYGCINKDNSKERAYYLEGMNRLFRKYKLVGVYWDQGWYDRSQKPDYSFTIIDRETGQSVDQRVTDGLLRGRFGLSGETTLKGLKKTVKSIPVTSLTASSTELSMTVGEKITLTAGYEPAGANDVLLWKTGDDTVATVSGGRVKAKGIGTTTITLLSLNSDVTVNIPVTVTAKAAQNPVTQINVPAETVSLEIGDTAWTGATTVPADTDETLYYRSSDSLVATVSPLGKIVAVGEGTTTITVGSSGGQTKNIQVTVIKPVETREIKLALNVYYNDAGNNYYSNEEGSEVITVNQDGQYTLTFDCEKDLSDNAKKAGVNSLSNMTAIYIKDHSVTEGTASVSPLKSCDIRYDKIVVNGQELTIIKNDFKSALKSSGIFDTNDPINGWDGSAVSEVSKSGTTVSFSGIKKPTTISVTFTLQNFAFSD